MKFFRVGKSGKDGHRFDGAYNAWLPAVKCPICSLYAASSMGLPNIDLQQLPNMRDFKSGAPVSQARFEQMVSGIVGLLDEKWPVLPGMGLGPFHGRVVKSEARDFLWIHGRTLVLRESARELFLEGGISMVTGPAIIENGISGEVRADYAHVVQIQPVPCMDLRTLSFVEHRDCPSCGIHVRRWPERLFLELDMIPKGIDIFSVGMNKKIHPFENIIVSEQIVEIVERHGLSNIQFIPVDCQ